MRVLYMATRHHSRDVDGTTQRRRGEQGASFKFFWKALLLIILTPGRHGTRPAPIMGSAKLDLLAIASIAALAAATLSSLDQTKLLEQSPPKLRMAPSIECASSRTATALSFAREVRRLLVVRVRLTLMQGNRPLLTCIDERLAKSGGCHRDESAYEVESAAALKTRRSLHTARVSTVSLKSPVAQTPHAQPLMLTNALSDKQSFPTRFSSSTFS